LWFCITEKTIADKNEGGDNLATVAKIASVHGRNISLNIRHEDLSRAPEDFQGSLTLPALNTREVDYAAVHIGDYVDYDVWNGKLWFPFLYQGVPLDSGGNEVRRSEKTVEES